MTIVEIKNKCGYCDKLRKAWRDKRGWVHSYYKTCGSRECLEAAKKLGQKNQTYIKDENVKRNCIKCNVEYRVTSFVQKWCPNCAPDMKARWKLRKYNVSASEHKTMLIVQDGKCFICRERPAVAIDHNHSTGGVRGLLCRSCNHGLSFLENKQWLENANKYLEIYK